MVTEEPGFITSPGYENGKYPPFLTCAWLLIAPEDTLIRIKFLDIELPRVSSCSDDRVELNYEDDVIPYIRFCSDSLPEDTIINANSIPQLTFSSGRIAKNLRGFKIEYSLVQEKPNCDDGQFACKYPFQCISSSLSCNGVADCYDGSDEENCGHKADEFLPDCGSPKVQPETGNDMDRIIGGRVALPHSWPWQLSLQAIFIFPSGHLCGAALINNLWVATAAHCVTSKDVGKYRVKFGVDNLFDKSDGEGIRYVEKIFVHPDFTSDPVRDDVALVKLSAPISYSDFVSPVCLPETDEEVAIGTHFHITGWGDTINHRPSETLRQVMVPSLPWEQCNVMHQVNGGIGKETICTGYPNGGHNPCFGDSGGPMVLSKDNQWALYGVVSWGPSVCGIADKPTVYTKISTYRNWMEEVVSSND